MDQPPMESTHTVVLMSGGIDSSSVVAVSQEAGAQPSGIFVDYGQPAARSEWCAAQKIARHYDVEIRKVNLGFRLVSCDGEFFARNALLILTVAGMTEDRPLQIALGIHALSEYYDTTPLFLRQMQRMLNGYFVGTVTLSTPFLAGTKVEIVRFARDNGVPLNLTYSCEIQNAPECGRCPSCQDRIDANAG